MSNLDSAKYSAVAIFSPLAKKEKHRILNCCRKVLISNFQSLKNKKAGLLNIIESDNPAIVMSTETWLHSGVHNSEIVPPTYEDYR